MASTIGLPFGKVVAGAGIAGVGMGDALIGGAAGAGAAGIGGAGGAGAAGAGLGVYALLAIVGIWKPLGTYSPAGLGSQAAGLASGQHPVVLWPVLTSLLLSVCLVYLASRVFRRSDL